MSDPVSPCNPSESTDVGTGNVGEPRQRYLSAKASRADASAMTEEEREAAEREAEEWARRVNCC